ncbi:MAG: phosphoglucosamine mutase [Bacteroidales bacterium]|nr:phosphoglucosamine mutase [Bacteroidales bacterium]
MSLIKSISGIRGTIGGRQGEGLSPLDVVRFTAAFGEFIKRKNDQKAKVVVGRDARISGNMINRLVNNSLIGMGIDVVDLGLSTTPTVEMAVPAMRAQGGIIVTASHNPREWNALKLLNEAGEFISAEDGRQVLNIADGNEMIFADVDNLGRYANYERFVQEHIDKILALPLVDINAIKAAGFRVVVDCINSTGGIAIPPLLKALGVENVEMIHCDPTGEFAHNPEPVPAHLNEISKRVIAKKADVGFAVDPDVDRLAIVCENGEMFGEEYTLVAIADYVLQHQKGNTVSNLSSSKALSDISKNAGVDYFAAAVGEVNVVEKMKEVNAVIGGEGNGGVIYPDLHYGRDAMVGIALFLSYLAKSDKMVSGIRKQYPDYVIQKSKIELDEDIDMDAILSKIKEKYQDYPVNTIDGVKIEFDREWVHLRKSNTEPIVRIYAESRSKDRASALAERFVKELNEMTRTLNNDVK